MWKSQSVGRKSSIPQRKQSGALQCSTKCQSTFCTADKQPCHIRTENVIEQIQCLKKTNCCGSVTQQKLIFHLKLQTDETLWRPNFRLSSVISCLCLYQMSEGHTEDLLSTQIKDPGYQISVLFTKFLSLHTVIRLTLCSILSCFWVHISNCMSWQSWKL